MCINLVFRATEITPCSIMDLFDDRGRPGGFDSLRVKPDIDEAILFQGNVRLRPGHVRYCAKKQDKPA